MNHKPSSGSFLFSIFLVNALGYLLRYSGYNTFFILFGFRFHISLFLPFILILRKEQRTHIRQTIIEPVYKGKFLPLLWIVIPLAVVSVSPFFTGMIKQGDPEHFYEFGLSTLFDYPLYLIWNFPQLLLFFLYLTSISSAGKKKFLIITAAAFFLFLFELVPVNFAPGIELNYFSLAALFLAACICSILISFFENIYWFSISIFSILWTYLLAFGTDSSSLVNILFASRYQSWEGFLISSKAVSQYLFPVYLLLIIILILIPVPLRKGSNKLYLHESENVPQVP